MKNVEILKKQVQLLKDINFLANKIILQDKKLSTNSPS